MTRSPKRRLLRCSLQSRRTRSHRHPERRANPRSDSSPRNGTPRSAHPRRSRSLLWLRFVPGLDLEVRLLGDLPAGETFLQFLQNFATLHYCLLHRYCICTKYLSVRARIARSVWSGEIGGRRPADVRFSFREERKRAVPPTIPADLFPNMNPGKSSWLFIQSSRIKMTTSAAEDSPSPSREMSYPSQRKNVEVC